jgi:ceramide glucosyltransferase
MFYAIRRSVLEDIGGFEGLENVLADDFAIAQRMRQHGYRLAQTPLRHGISTWVSKPGDYFNLLQRWFIFPRESMLRHLKGHELWALYVSVMLPVFFPWLALLLALVAPSYLPVTLTYLAYSYLVFAHINWAYMKGASPWAQSYWVILIALFMPIQILIALGSPKRIIWRGHTIQAEPGGGFVLIRRRKQES